MSNDEKPDAVEDYEYELSDVEIQQIKFVRQCLIVSQSRVDGRIAIHQNNIVNTDDDNNNNSDFDQRTTFWLIIDGCPVWRLSSSCRRRRPFVDSITVKSLLADLRRVTRITGGPPALGGSELGPMCGFLAGKGLRERSITGRMT
ncbi:unnamed protein product [Heligmosomoides polygyrus]|uniref:Uncharacterized protein n=1 Tax=Heligmosomoides polygyrus TaxID=6339 RepID=A0A183FHG5_HELPZ|nr:unnamed protein product [Heligmosomoides polygyrus]